MIFYMDQMNIVVFPKILGGYIILYPPPKTLGGQSPPVPPMIYASASVTIAVSLANPGQFLK
jgi:hypothetical protein